MGRPKKDRSNEPVNEIVLSPHEIAGMVERARKRENMRSGYPLELKLLAIAMRANGMKLQEICNVIGVGSPQTILDWVNDPKLIDNVEYIDYVGKIKDGLASKQYLLTNQILSSINDEDIEKAGLLQKVTAGAVLQDKARAIEGKPTTYVQIEGQIDNFQRQELEVKAEIERLQDDRQKELELDA